MREGEGVEGRGPDGGAGPLRRAARRLLRVPLYYKIAGANALLLLATLVGGVWVSRQPDHGEWLGGPLLLGGLVVVLGVALNLALLRTALGPVEEIEETARRVERGDFGARAATSPVADRDLRRLIEVFNRMLDAVARYRRRQRALTLRTFEEEERNHEEAARRIRQSAAQRLATILVRLRAVRARLAVGEGEETYPEEADVEGPEGGAGTGDGAEAAVLDALEEARELARETLEDLKRTARGLRRPEIDDLGLARALRAYAAELAGPGGPRVELEGEGLGGCLARETRFRLYRLLQEAVANAVEHAEAETVNVRLAAEEGSARAEVLDDGVGFRTGRGDAGVSVGAGPDPGGEGMAGRGPADGDRGLGLVAMRERARDLGADLTVQSEPGRGTRVRVTLPCDGDAADL